MSMFLPEGMNQGQSQPGTADITPASPETTSSDIALMQRVLAAAARNVNLIPPDFMAYVVDFIQTARLQIPIGQVPGFKQFTVKTADDVVTSESTVSTSFTDLTTPGPTLAGLSDGSYLFYFGGTVQVSNVLTAATMVLDVNGVIDTNVCKSPDTSGNTIMRAIPYTLSGGGSNTVTVKYKCESGNGTTDTAAFGGRFLYALRISN